MNLPNMRESESHQSSIRPQKTFLRHLIPRFRLYLVFVSVTALSVVCLWIGRAEKQRQAVEWVHDRQGTVEFGESKVPPWLTVLIGGHYFQSVESVEVMDWPDPAHDISPIASFPKLKRLTLIRKQIDWEIVGGLSKLESLYVSGFEDRPQDLRVFSKLKHLRYLCVHMSEVSNIQPIEELRHLTELHLTGIKCNDLSALENLKHLDYLDVSSSTVRDLSSLPNLRQLSKFKYYGAEQVDLKPLVGVAGLVSLDLSGSKKLVSLEAVKQMTSLKHLDISNSDVVDLSFLAGHMQLESLVLRDTQVSDLSPLSGLINLRSLDISNTQVSNIQTLFRLPRLSEVKFSKSRVSRNDVSKCFALLQDRRLADLKKASQ